MRALTRSIVLAGALALALATGPPPAHAVLDRISTDDDELLTRTFGGNSENLPVRPTLGWREAVAWARTMPAVQVAMQTFAQRGYLAVPERDTACTVIDPPATCVVLSYLKPEIPLPPTSSGRPMIVVYTYLNREGVPATVVTAGIMVADQQAHAVFCADSLPQFAGDGSFDVPTAGAGEPGVGDRRLGPAPSPPWPTMPPKFGKFLRCFAVVSNSCLFTLWADLPPRGTPATDEPRETIVLIRFFICEVNAAITCIEQIANEEG